MCCLIGSEQGKERRGVVRRIRLWRTYARRSCSAHLHMKGGRGDWKSLQFERGRVCASTPNCWEEEGGKKGPEALQCIKRAGTQLGDKWSEAKAGRVRPSRLGSWVGGVQGGAGVSLACEKFPIHPYPCSPCTAVIQHTPTAQVSKVWVLHSGLQGHFVILSVWILSWG